MATTTAPRTPVPTDDQITRERLRTAVPVLLAVLLLFGTMVVGALVLRDMLDFGVWLLSSR